MNIVKRIKRNNLIMYNGGYFHPTGFSKKLYRAKVALKVRLGFWVSGICPTCKGTRVINDPHRNHPHNVLFADRFICYECDEGRQWYVYHHKRKVWNRVY